MSVQIISGQIISIDNKINISGTVIESETNQPLEYATVSFIHKGQETIIGTTTDINGFFKIDIDPGVYNIYIDFLSFETYELKSKILIKDLNLGTLILKIDNKLDEIEVVADKQLVEFKINKKIYNASADIANRGGNALDVLSNTPSVRVDSEGNISARGSSVTILIDGKPQFNIDNNTDILQAMPSNSIDKVEIITRSAKYSAEGGGAILNIITKKRKASGFNGSIEARTGIPDNHGISSFINKNNGKVNLYSTISYLNENRIKESDFEQPALGLFERINEDRLRNTILVNLGSDFYLNEKSTLFTSFLVNNNSKNIVFEIFENDFNRRTDDADDIFKIEASIGYLVKLDTLGQKLSFNFKYENTDSDTDDTILEVPSGLGEDIFQRSFKDQLLTNFLAQIDYTLPINNNTNLEFGYKGTFRNYENIFKVEELDNLSNNYSTVNNLDDTFNYIEDVHAFYGLYNATQNKLSYSIGLRTEITNVSIQDQNNSNPVTKNYTDLFPSLTLAYELSDDSYISMNYSRSVNRPSIPQINPFISFSDQRFQTIGNQNLNPFYTNYFELLFDQSFNKLNISSALFLNYQKDQFLSVIQNTGQITSNGDEIFERVHINSGDKNIIGLDLDLTYTPFKGLRLNAYVSPYRQEITNALDAAYNNKNTVYYAEGNALISINNDLKIRLAHAYQSPINYGLAKLKSINFSNITLSKNIFKKNGTITFRAIDVFRTKRFLYESLEANTSTNYNVYYQNQYNLSFVYRFNQKSKSKKDRSKEIDKDDLEDKQDKKM